MTIQTLAFLIAGLAIPATLSAQTPAAVPVISVNGTAEVQVAPDAVTVQLGVVRQAPTAQLAQDQVNSAAQDILAALGKLGVAAQKIQTSRLSLTPAYSSRVNSNDAPKIVGYSASNVVSVDLDNLTLTGPVIDAGLKAGANQLDGVHFRLKNDRVAREQALKLAATEAKGKAGAIAEALGLRLGPVVEVSEGGVSIMPQAEVMSGFAMARMAADTATPVSAGELQVRASVNVRYRIENP